MTRLGEGKTHHSNRGGDVFVYRAGGERVRVVSFYKIRQMHHMGATSADIAKQLGIWHGSDRASLCLYLDKAKPWVHGGRTKPLGFSVWAWRARGRARAAIMKRRRSEGWTLREVASAFGCSRQNICQCIRQWGQK